jgi:hypothetical protein
MWLQVMGKLLMILSSAAFSCFIFAGSLNAKTGGANDSWWRMPENPGVFYKNRISEKNFSEVDQSMQMVAQRLLTHVSMKEITKSQAVKFSYDRLKLEGGSALRFYLVRAVRLVEGGRFSAFRHGSSVYIVHGDLGSPRQTRKSALVVAVDGEILKVFATCTTAE